MLEKLILLSVAVCFNASISLLVRIRSSQCTCVDYTVRNLVCCHIHPVSLEETEGERNPPMADDIVDDVAQKRES